VITVTDPCVLAGVSDADYHSDKMVPGGSLAYTGVRRILASPAL